MDMTTRYLGFELPHPLMVGASPLVDDLDTVRRVEDAGSSMICMHSLFEEQITAEEVGTIRAMEMHAESYAEATSYFPEPDDFTLGPEEYLERIRRIKATVAVPVVGSLNGTTRGGWLRYAPLIAEAGADALELNVYELVTDATESADDVESRIVDILGEVKKSISIPVAVKLSHFHTSIAHLAEKLQIAGADGLVLFNRFYQPDIDIEELEVKRSITLSGSHELLVRLRWLAILRGNIACSLAASGGVHTVEDAIKAVMTGADAVQVVSAVLQRGPTWIGELRSQLEQWLEEHEYESLQQMRGSMSLARCPDPHAYERANYLETLLAWKGGA